MDDPAMFLAWLFLMIPWIIGAIAFIQFCRRVLQLLREISTKLDDRFDELVEAVDDTP